MKQQTKQLMVQLIVCLVVAPLVTAQPTLPEDNEEFVMLFPCFVDGNVFYADGTPVPRGVEVQVYNKDTDETFTTTTGYQHPPVEEYDNDYKTVFGCEYGMHRVVVKANNGTHFDEQEVVIPINGLAIVNLTLEHSDKLSPKQVVSAIKNYLISLGEKLVSAIGL